MITGWTISTRLMLSPGDAHVKENSMEKAFLRPMEVADIIGLGRSKTYLLIKSGVIPSVRLGASVRVPAEALNKWIQTQIENSCTGESPRP
jgi:excisionase family DNA binding protein